jgi:hypothetical protein
MEKCQPTALRRSSKCRAYIRMDCAMLTGDRSGQASRLPSLLLPASLNGLFSVVATAP